MQNTFSQSGNDSKWFLKKSFFKIGMWHSRPPRDPLPLHGKCHLKFPFWLLAHLPYCSCKILERSSKWASSSWLQPSFASFYKCNWQKHKRSLIKIKNICLKWIVLTGSTWHNHQAKVQLTTIKTFCWTNWITTDILLNVIPVLFCFVVQSV